MSNSINITISLFPEIEPGLKSVVYNDRRAEADDAATVLTDDSSSIKERMDAMKCLLRFASDFAPNQWCGKKDHHPFFGRTPWNCPDCANEANED